MASVVKQAVYFGLGAVSFTKEKLKNWVDDNQILERGEREKEEMRRFIKDSIQSSFSKLNIPQQSDIHRLEQRIAKLEELLAQKQ
ncbi:phasin family protein [Fodinisporobacter ferrooxydans]|uniref:Phasin family protein n=1 Tax=Fodinisporobacter ferrooxydans TaxID=2901836 RepID=A0ABY4CE81_9BACL|nr:phasin family protein [Alicyclobacillaceae bacterium MYW30-H2]